jgi:hypothetical protein
MIEASGVRRSCDIEVSIAERSRSRSAPSCAFSALSASISRSIATAIWLQAASRRSRSSGGRRPDGSSGRTPITPISDRPVWIGMKKRDEGVTGSLKPPTR